MAFAPGPARGWALEELPVHFGLGYAVDSVHRVYVRWPASGAELELLDLDVDQRVTQIEPE